MNIVISSGHGKLVRGASGHIDEVDEARRVVDRVAEILRRNNVVVRTFHDDTSTTQDENLHTIVDFHNSCMRDLDISVHFNAYNDTSKPMGVEVLYVTATGLASTLSAAIAEAGSFIDRGGKYRDNLYFLNHTEEAAILIEVCFVDSTVDADLYTQNFEKICQAIANVIGGEQVEPEERQVTFSGSCSWFGGPDDEGVAPDEGLAFIYEVDDAPQLFLSYQPEGTTGLARRLDPNIFYVACRWDYDKTPKDMLVIGLPALVTAKKTGKKALAWPADWGPHVDTGRAADISPSLMHELGIDTDDEVEVIYPAPKRT